MQSEKKIVTNFKVTLNEASEIKTSQRKRWVSKRHMEENKKMKEMAHAHNETLNRK